MAHRLFGFLAVLTILSLASAHVAGQSPSAPKTNWSPPRTPDGQPDLEGIWTNGTVTPFERPAELAGKAFFTEQEAAQFEKQTAAARNSDHRGASADQDLLSAYNNRWYDWGSKVVKTRRTSIIIDPPDGRVPALTLQAQDANRAWAERQRKPPEGPEDIGLAERCIAFPTAGPPMLPYAYNNNYRIVQVPGYVVIFIEMVHDVRRIPWTDVVLIWMLPFASGWETRAAIGRTTRWWWTPPISTARTGSDFCIAA